MVEVSNYQSFEDFQRELQMVTPMKYLGNHYYVSGIVHDHLFHMILTLNLWLIQNSFASGIIFHWLITYLSLEELSSRMQRW